ncbi:hypothetical protein ACYATP_02320 [Lactobacillaceae bacterium Melli_B4]
MNYKNALVALAATLTLGVSPALTSVNAKTTTNDTTKTTKKADTKKSTKKATKKTKSSNPKASSSYWTKDIRHVQVTKNTKAIKAKLVQGKGITPVKNGNITLKKGSQVYLKKSNGVWLYITVGSNNKASYFVITDSKTNKSTNWFKIVKDNQTTNNSSNNNTNNTNSTQNNKTLVTLKSNYQTAQGDNFTSTDYANGFVSPSSKTFTSNGTTITAGEKYQVKLMNVGTDQNPNYLYQFQVGNNTVTAPMSNDLLVTNINVFPVSSGNNNDNSNIYASEYTPDSSDAVVSKNFKVTNGTKWYTVPNFGSNSTPTNIYIYSSSQNAWLKTHINSSNQLEYDYQ